MMRALFALSIAAIILSAQAGPATYDLAVEGASDLSRLLKKTKKALVMISADVNTLAYHMKVLIEAQTEWSTQERTKLTNEYTTASAVVEGEFERRMADLEHDTSLGWNTAHELLNKTYKILMKLSPEYDPTKAPASGEVNAEEWFHSTYVKTNGHTSTTKRPWQS